MTADKIIYGNIYTVDREQPRAAAAATTDSKISSRSWAPPTIAACA